ncbi:helix-turn-helix domain-containing protein [Actinomyces oris]|uniref:helix-turn-helix domain-containing protein n=1 Tax=Actinomyces oris TaxID=544580 RepID=UPI0009D64775|nr:helix-turn-helix domain-containing protein [Actinomyces oris]
MSSNRSTPSLRGMLSASAAAEILKVSPKTITRWIESGEISTVDKLPGKYGTWLIDEREVARVAQKRREELLSRLPQDTAPRSRADQKEAA